MKAEEEGEAGRDKRGVRKRHEVLILKGELAVLKVDSILS